MKKSIYCSLCSLPFISRNDPLVTVFSKQSELPAGRARRIEFRGIQGARRAREPVALAGKVETVANDFSEDPGASHARTETGIVLLTAAHIAHPVHDARGLQRFVDLQPLLEQLLNLSLIHI